MSFVIRFIRLVPYILLILAVMWVAYYLITRLFRAAVEYFKIDIAENMAWLRSKLPKFRRRRKRRNVKN
jgi:hypothetical protein